jgi:hypothetical protein
MKSGGMNDPLPRTLRHVRFRACSRLAPTVRPSNGAASAGLKEAVSGGSDRLAVRRTSRFIPNEKLVIVAENEPINEAFGCRTSRLRRIAIRFGASLSFAGALSVFGGRDGPDSKKEGVVKVAPGRVFVIGLRRVHNQPRLKADPSQTGDDGQRADRFERALESVHVSSAVERVEGLLDFSPFEVAEGDSVFNHGGFAVERRGLSRDALTPAP